MDVGIGLVRNHGSSRRIIRNVRVGRRRTSIGLELALWDALEDICRREGSTPSDICTALVAAGLGRGLTPAVRVFIVERLRRSEVPWLSGRPSAASTAHNPPVSENLVAGQVAGPETGAAS